MNTKSYWADSSRLPQFGKVGKDYRVDVVIIGGGITGVTAAHLFREAGCSVALVERGRIGGFDTINTTAHLTSVTDIRLSELAKHFGNTGAQKVWRAGQTAIERIVKNVEVKGIACGFKRVPAYYHLPVSGGSDEEADELSHDAQVAHELGIDGAFVASAPLVRKPAIQFPNQAVFHPARYIGGLLRGLRGRGCHVFEQSEVSAIKSRPLAVRVGDYEIRCGYVFVATHTPLMGKTPLLAATLFQTKLFLYTTYALRAKIARGQSPEASFFDTSDPYYYLRVDRLADEDYAIFGGEDHKTGQLDNELRAYAGLERAFHGLFPQAHVDHRWSGQVIETPDGLPYIGETAKNQFVATGFAGNGMTFGTLGAMMAVDAFQKRKNPWQELFDPHRKPIHGGSMRMVRENKDFPLYYVRDRMARLKPTSLSALRCNQGKIIESDGHKVAAYREESGKLHLMSPICPHLQCIVAWNPAEKTWDCPCHGSRFAATGEVLSGPAEENLASVSAAKASNGR